MKNTTKDQLEIGDLVRFVEVDDRKVNQLRLNYGTGPFFIVGMKRDDSGVQMASLLVHFVDSEGCFLTTFLGVPTDVLDRVEVSPVEIFHSGDEVYFRELPESRAFRDQDGRSLTDLYGPGEFQVEEAQWENSSRPGSIAHPQWINLGGGVRVSGFFLTKDRKKADRRRISANRTLRDRELKVTKRRPFGWWAWQVMARVGFIAAISMGVAGGWFMAEFERPGIPVFMGMFVLIAVATISLIPAMICWMFCQDRAGQYEDYYDYRLPK